MGRRNTFLKFTLRNLKTNKANMRCIHLTSAEIGLEMKRPLGRRASPPQDNSTNPLIMLKNAVEDLRWSNCD